MNQISELKIQLIAKLLAQHSHESTEIDECDNIISELECVIEKSDYPNKSEIINSFRSTLNEIELLNILPGIVGKTIIGVFGDKSDSCRKLKDFMYNDHWSKSNQNIITVITKNGSDQNNSDTIKILSLHKNLIELNELEYCNLQNLYKDDIDSKSIVKLANLDSSSYTNLVFIDIPPFADKNSSLFNEILKYIDYAVFPVQDTTKYIEPILYKLNINSSVKEVIFLTNSEYLSWINKNITYLKMKSEGSTIVNIDSIVDFKSFFQNFDIIRNNYELSDFFFITGLEFIKQQFYLLENLKEQLSNVNKDVVLLDDSDTKDFLDKIKRSLIVSKKESEKILVDFRNLLNKLIEKVNQIEAKISNSIVTESYHNDIIEIRQNIIINLIELGEIKEAKEIMKTISAEIKGYKYIYDLYIHDKSDMELSERDLVKLKKNNLKNEFVIKAKIKFREKLNISNIEAGELLYNTNREKTAEDFFCIAEYLHNDYKQDEAKLLYEKSLNAGYLESGNSLVNKYKLKFGEIKLLADKLVPQACYSYGKKLYSNDNNESSIKEGIIYLRIAGVLGCLDAVKFIAHNSYEEYRQKRKNNFVKQNTDINEIVQDDDLNIALRLYKYLCGINKDDSKSWEKLGTIKKDLGDHRGALEALKNSNTAQAYFLMGKIYQHNGNGVAQDLPLSKKMFKQSIDLGHKYAKAEYDKVIGWIKSNNLEKKEKVSYAPKMTYRQESSGCCHVVTATCKALDMEKEFFSIENLFKHFRNRYFLKDRKGISLVREYYRVSPILVDKINSEKKPNIEYENLWKKFISPCLENITNNNRNSSKILFINMVTYLSDKYDVDLEVRDEIIQEHTI